MGTFFNVVLVLVALYHNGGFVCHGAVMKAGVIRQSLLTPSPSSLVIGPPAPVAALPPALMKPPPPPVKKHPPPPPKKKAIPKKKSPPPKRPPPRMPPAAPIISGPSFPPIPAPPSPPPPPQTPPPPPPPGVRLPPAGKRPYFSILLANSKVSAIHAVLTHLKTVIFIDRTDTVNTQIRLRNGQWAYALEFNLKTRAMRPLDVLSNTFCSTGQALPDGTILNVGGSSKGKGNLLANGATSIRQFTPCTDGTCGWNIVGNLTTNRWYAASQILPDGRVIIIGGVSTSGNILINSRQVNAPSYEFYPRAPGEGSYPLQLLVDSMPNNLYAFTHLLPSGYLFIFAGSKSIVYDFVNHQVIKQLPDLGPPGVYRNYPVTGTSFMLPLTPENNYKAEIVVCGGNYGSAYYNPNQYAATDCGRISPDDPNPTWETEPMPFPWVMPDIVQLVDGTFVIINGAKQGFEQLNQSTAKSPNFNPVHYDPNQPLGFRFTPYPAKTNIARMYHSVALLMPDATVMLSGSNPNNQLTRTGSFPTEFRVETFAPHYLHKGMVQPKLIVAPPGVPYSGVFTISGTVSPTSIVTGFKVAIINPGFCTHAQRYGQRYVQLNIISVAVTLDGIFTAAVQGPPSSVIAPPGFYWLHFVDNGIPNVEGVAFSITPT